MKPQKMKIYLVRHGESEANVDKTLYLNKPDHAMNLTDAGIQQATDAGAFLQNYMEQNSPVYFQNRLWISPYTRTRQTAKHLGLGDTHVKDRGEHIALVEQQFGLFDGIPEDQLPEIYPKEHAHYKKCQDFEGRFWARMPLGESRFDVSLRLQQFFGTINRDKERHNINDVVIVAHGVVIRAFVMMWCHKSWEWFENEPNPKNCSIRLIDGKSDLGYIYEGETPIVEDRSETI